MDRTRRLADVWNWLPAFRAVAEVEHLPTAGERLHVSPAALSRSIRLLEESLDLELFERANRRIILNEQGALLLEYLRDGMRLLDDGLDAAISEEVRGPILFSAPGPFAALYVVPAIVELAARYPNVEPHMGTASAPEAVRRLKAGLLDIALLDDPLPDEQLKIERFVDLEYGVYCGPAHPLYRKRDLRLGTIIEHPFAAPPEGADDHWPKDLPRTIRFRLASLQHGVDLCSAGACLAVLPNVVADAAQAKLRRLPVEGFEPAALYLVSRRPIGPRNRTTLALDAIRRSVVPA